MKKIKAILLSVVFCLSLSACSKEESDDFNQTAAFENMRNYYSQSFESEDYYLQMSKTKSESHVMTEASKSGDDCVFLEYDVSGALKFFRNDKLSSISPETFYQVDSNDAKWEDFSYEKTAKTYRSVLDNLCKEDFSDIGNENSLLKELTYEKTEDENFPYKVSALFNLEKLNTKELFGNSGNFGSVSIKFLSDKDGLNFDDISLYVQYDFNDEIYVISVKFGEANLPDEKGENGQRPEDIEKEYNKNLEELQASFEQYLEEMQNYSTT